MDEKKRILVGRIIALGIQVDVSPHVETKIHLLQ